MTFIVNNDNQELFSVQPSISSDGQLTYEAKPDISGNTTVTVELTDNGGVANGGNNRSDPQTFTITVLSVNDAPVFVRGPNQAVGLGSGPQTVEAWATGISAGPPDESNQTLSFSLSAEPPSLFSVQPALAINGSEASLTYTPTTSDTGRAVVTVQLMDSGDTANGGVNTSIEQSFTISIGVDNTPPSIMLISPPEDSIVAPPHNVPFVIQAKATDLENNLESVWIKWSLNDAPQMDIELDRGEGDLFNGSIPALEGGNRVAFNIIAADSAGLKDSTQVRPEYMVRPSTPNSISIDVEDDRITLNWPPSVGAESYILFRDTNEDVQTLLASGIEDTMYVDTNIDSDSTYFYSILAANEGGTSNPSFVGSLCTPEPPSTTPISGPNRIVLRWTADMSCELVGILIMRNDVQIDSLAATVTEYVDTNVTNGDSYEYDVIPVTVDGRRGMPAMASPIQSFPYPESQNIQASVPFGDHTLNQNYKLVGLPGTSSIPLASTFEGTHGMDWRAFYDNGSDSDQLDDFLVPYSSGAAARFTFQPGRGFWVIQNQPWSVQQEVPTVALTLDNEFAIDVQPGWNIISNPYFESVSWSDVQAANGGITEDIFGFNQTFSPSMSMRPNEGYYFFNGRTPALTQLIIPYPVPGASKQSLRVAKPNSADVPGLRVQVVDSEERMVDAQLGILEQSSYELDQHDRFAPPGVFSALSIQFYNPYLTTGYKYLSHEFRPEIGDGQTFNLLLSSTSDEAVTIEFEGMDTLSDEEIRFIDLATGRRFDLRQQPRLSLDLANHPGKFAIAIGTLAYVDDAFDDLLPDSFNVYPAYPNPFKDAVTIEYSIPEEYEGQRIRLEVFNMLGQKVATLLDQTHAPGNFKIRWDGRDALGQLLASGVYVYRFAAASYQNAQTFVVVR